MVVRRELKSQWTLGAFRAVTFVVGFHYCCWKSRVFLCENVATAEKTNAAKHKSGLRADKNTPAASWPLQRSSKILIDVCSENLGKAEEDALRTFIHTESLATLPAAIRCYRRRLPDHAFLRRCCCWRCAWGCKNTKAADLVLLELLVVFVVARAI